MAPRQHNSHISQFSTLSPRESPRIVGDETRKRINTYDLADACIDVLRESNFGHSLREDIQTSYRALSYSASVSSKIRQHSRLLRRHGRPRHRSPMFSSVDDRAWSHPGPRWAMTSVFLRSSASRRKDPVNGPDLSSPMVERVSTRT
jgi:hypothetical protein